MADKFELTDGEPAAPGGKANVKWQSDVNGNISAYVDLAGHIIQDEGTARTQRGALNFVGSAVAATDDAANNRTNVTVTAQAQTPWAQEINAANFALVNAGQILPAATGANATVDGGAIVIREVGRAGGSPVDVAHSPRLGFYWQGAGYAQIGLSESVAHTIRTFNIDGTAYAPFAAAQITARSELVIEAAAGAYGLANFTIPIGTKRWGIGKEATAETGSNSGSNFHIYRYDDAGGFLGTVLEIIRSTGVTKVNSGLVLLGLPTSATGPSGTVWRDAAAGNVLKIVP